MEGQNGKNSLISIIVQAGAVGLALVAMAMLWSIVTNHINYNSDMLSKLESRMEQSNIIMKDNYDATKSLNETLKIFMAQMKK